MSSENIHDKLFKATMSDRENALDFFRSYLPAELLENLDLNSLNLEKGSFIDDSLKEGFSDTLYRVGLKSGEEAYLYILFDHKSKADRYTGLQLLGYMVKIWQRYRNHSAKKKQRHQKLPMILPIVVYHGQKRWKHGLDFQSMIETPKKYERFVPRFDFLFYDLPRVADESIMGNEVLQASFYLFKYSFHPDLGENLGTILQLLERIEDENRQNRWLTIILNYLIRGPEQITLDRLEKLIESLDLEGVRKTMPTIADALEQRGYNRGEQIGYSKGEQIGYSKGKRLAELRAERAERKEKLRTALKMQEAGSELAFIVEITELEKAYLIRFFRRVGRIISD
ncbi:MAG: Rpn family recombination-promoting nuclease/putative transposase [Leptospiraceae bacterium]|nr:Rpn family recombination-promoting nuclease/putative transposase [Leptospiraceae bacterium]MCP5499971.1 Rpn family recombination-promoting nuclease/putative transposase [Leptospiraceae bacterium]